MVANVRKTAHESLEADRLRDIAKRPEKHHLLRKILSFFEALGVDKLLDSVRDEPKRDRRRMLLALLEAHGPAAREAALNRLGELFAGAEIAKDWYFARNLLCLLNRIPRPDDVSPEFEIGLMEPALRLSLAAPLVREAIINIGQIRHRKAEQLLIATVDQLESLLLDPAHSPHDPARLKSLLDRSVFSLARHGTPRAYRRVVEHGLLRREELGDTAARLAYLCGQNLTDAEEGVACLLKALKSRMPRRILGMRIQKNEETLIHLIRALSSTPIPAVQQAFEVIARRFPETEFGTAASRALEELGAPTMRPEVPTERLLGDLDLFGLPDLLQQLALLRLTGTLIIRDRNVEPVGTISLSGGLMRSCSVGCLEGTEAFYQLFEKPVAGTFVFQGRREPAGQEQSDASQTSDLRSLIIEGTRRYDELQRERAIVPDSSFLIPTRSGRRPQPNGENASFLEQLWNRVSAGATPDQCEGSCQSDAYRVRTLLARWVEEDIITVLPQMTAPVISSSCG
jgi:hypothetical protein